MKIIYINITILFSFFISIVSCKAQEYPLNTDFTTIQNYSYLKDLNNELSPYVGVYEANFQSKNITLYITQENHKLIDYVDQKFYRDVLCIKYIIKNSVGSVLQDTKSINFLPDEIRHTIYSMRTRPSQNSIIFDYGGTNCSVGNGKIILKKLNSTQISWEYRPNDIILDSSKCPPGTDIKIYLPETKDLIFTKQ